MAKKKTGSQAKRQSSAPGTTGTRKKTTRRRTTQPADAKRQEYAKALGIYERALETLQRGKYSNAATLFQRVIDQFPDERELHERSHRYLEVCERQSAPAPTPKTLEERVYAATLALNDGDTQQALTLLGQAHKEAPESDHVAYMLAVAHATAGEAAKALSHLNRAIDLNPDNRFLALHESGFESLREDDSFRQAVGGTAADGGSTDA